MVNKYMNTYMKKYSASLSIIEIEVETTPSCHLIWERMTVSKKSNNNKCWNYCDEKRILLHCWWKFKLVEPL